MNEKEKNIWRLARDNAHLSRENVEQLTSERITAKMLEKIESGSQEIRPEQVLLLAETYKDHNLCLNYYCSQVCPIGRAFNPYTEYNLAKAKDLTRISMELLKTLNELVDEERNLIKITADGIIDSTELEIFKNFTSKLEEMELAIKSMKAWSKNNISKCENNF